MLDWVKDSMFGPWQRKTKVYIAGSLSNRSIVDIHMAIEKEGNAVCFSSWLATHPEADDYWRDYEKARGKTFADALKQPSAQAVFNFDRTFIDLCDIMVMCTPCGKSAHLELGYVLGKGKTGLIYMPEEPERWDVMYGFANGVYTDIHSLIDRINRF